MDGPFSVQIMFGTGMTFDVFDKYSLHDIRQSFVRPEAQAAEPFATYALVNIVGPPGAKLLTVDAELLREDEDGSQAIGFFPIAGIVPVGNGMFRTTVFVRAVLPRKGRYILEVSANGSLAGFGWFELANSEVQDVGEGTI